jgi:hypothetical protein
MTKTYILEPEVPGGLGPRTQMDRSTHPPIVSVVHFVFDGWLGDQLVESFPCYLVAPSLAQALADAGITGIEFADAEIETSEQFEVMYPNRLLPDFKWLKVVGNPTDSDMFITSDNRLAASERTLDVILATGPKALEYRDAL